VPGPALRLAQSADGTLKRTLIDNRPTKFASNQKDAWVLIVFKRQKP
jgi:hypothetical protein